MITGTESFDDPFPYQQALPVVDFELVRTARGVLPRGGNEAGSIDPCQPNIVIPHKGQFASVCAEFLPPLSPGRVSRAARRYVDPRWI